MSHILEFLDLIDVPNTYSGLPGRPVIVNATVDGVIFSDLAADYVSLNSLSFGGVLNTGIQDVQTAMVALDDHVHDYYLLRSEWLENGFVDRADTTLTWNDGTRTLTLAPAVTSFDYYYAGYKYTETGSLYAIIPDTEGLYVFYIAEGDAVDLAYIHNPSYEEVEAAIEDECIVAYVYWDATNNDGRLLDERHGYVLGRGTHHYLHELFGAQYRDGMTLGDILTDQNGGSDTHAQFSITAGTFYDEDIGHVTLAHASTDTWEAYYVDGSGNVRWVMCEATFPVVAIGGVIAWNNAGTLTAADNNKYICYHVFATNIKTDAGGSYYPVVTPGTAQYNSESAAQDAALSEIQSIDLGDWPKEEVIPIATVIYHHLAAMSNGVEAAIVATEGGGDFVDWRFTAVSGSSTSVNDHGALSGLTDVADHPGYVTLDGARALTADWDAGAFEIRALTFESDVATGTPPLVVASTTAVTNLNADLLDGNHAAAFAAASHSHVEDDITDLVHTDADAIHDNVAGEINALTTVTPATGDLLLIEDVSDSNNKKKVTITSLGSGHNHDSRYYTETEVGAAFIANIVQTWDDLGSGWPTKVNASGFFQSNSPSTANDWPIDGTSWMHLINCAHSSTGNYYHLQIAGDFFSQRLFFRETNNSGSQAWREFAFLDDLAIAPKTTAVTNSSGTRSFSVYGTVESGSSGPYIISLLSNPGSYSGYFELTVDGTVLFTDLLVAAGAGAVGVGGEYANSVFVRESFSVRCKAGAGGTGWRVSYQQVSVS